MGKVLIGATMSLDGFIADKNDGVGPMFDWYGNGDVAVTMADPDRVFKVTAASADYIRQSSGQVRATVIGRRLFDITNGWNGVPAQGDHVFVVTHRPPTDWPFPDAPYTFVPEGVSSAVERARRFAGDGDVAVAAGNIGGQAIASGLIDEVHISLTPVLLGGGRPFFGAFDGAAKLLENPRIIEGDPSLTSSTRFESPDLPRPRRHRPDQSRTIGGVAIWTTEALAVCDSLPSNKDHQARASLAFKRGRPTNAPG